MTRPSPALAIVDILVDTSDTWDVECGGPSASFGGVIVMQREAGCRPRKHFLSTTIKIH